MNQAHPKAAARRIGMTALLVFLLTVLPAWQAVFSYAANEPEGEQQAAQNNPADIEEIVADMSLDDKISQMLVPSIRYWEGKAVTDLDAVPQLKEALQQHPYGGLILFDSNIKDPAQTAALTAALQENNAQNIPYFMTVDAEGGLVMRLAGGTRMPGNMTSGAGGRWSRFDAFAAGAVIGEELQALGFNVDFAPDIDVNNDPANPVIGVRAFSDDPETVALLGTCYGNGLRSRGIVATYKHFPGHGDTDTDSHFGLPTIGKSYEELQKTELVPFKAAVESGADMIMTAHITFPGIDDEVTFADGTKGYYPATMSKKILTDILRSDLGYEGLIITDGFEMEAIADGKFVPGTGVDYNVNITAQAINAGADLILIPHDLNGAEAAAYYDTYIAGLVKKVEDGEIDESRINESVARILTVKQKYGILDPDGATAEPGQDDSAEEAAEEPAVTDIVGAEKHLQIEKKIALHGVTLVKNEETLPLDSAADLTGDGRQSIVIVGRSEKEAAAIEAEIAALREQGLIGEETAITTGTYYDNNAQTFSLSEAALAAAGQADAVVLFTASTGLPTMHDQSSQSQAVAALQSAMPEESRLIVVSGNLPYDAARYQEADAILLAYMGAALDADPTGNAVGAAGYNANTAAALDVIFGAASPQGTLPVNIPAVQANGDGSYSYTDEILYERGSGLTY